MRTHYDILCLYWINYINIQLNDIIKITLKNNLIYKKPAIKRDYRKKTRNILLWIRNTNKYPQQKYIKRNLLNYI
jgi:hypothetical protein